MSSIPPPPADSPQPGPAATGPAPQVVYVEKKKGGALKWLAIIGVVMLVLLGGCAALIAATASGVSEELEKQQESRATDEQLVEDNATIVSCGEGTLGPEVVVEFTNPLDEEKGYIGLEINFLDPSGVVIGDANVTFENLGPGQKARGEGVAFGVPEGSVVDSCVVADGTIL